MRLALLALFASTAASAWPVDVYASANCGEEKFQKLSALDWTEVESPAIAEVEALPSGEALISGKKAGDTLVLLYAEGKMAVWRVDVPLSHSCGELPRRDGGVEKYAPPSTDQGAPATNLAPLRDAVQKACPGLQLSSTGDVKLAATVKTDACRSALKNLLQTDAYNAREIELTYELPVLQTQLREMQSAIDAAVGKKRVTAVYSGAGLRLSGDVTIAEHKKVLWAVFKNSVGRVALEDRLNLTDKPKAPSPEQESP